jgi:alpha-tubulin suppressor-like RCC1 family protein
VACWGTNTSGQLGDGTTTLSLDPVTVPTLAGVIAVAAGSSRTCALGSGGGVRCWGAGYAVDPVAVTTIAGALDIAAGPQFTCVLAGDGTVRCWGDNTFGQLGAAAGPTSSTPVTALNVSGATAIATGSRHACAIVAGGAVKCWGENYYGQLGGSRGYDTAIQGGFAADYVTSLSGATAITCGSTHTCAVVGRTGVKCWGRNLDGQLGDGTRNAAFTPVDVVF